MSKRSWHSLHNLEQQPAAYQNGDSNGLIQREHAVHYEQLHLLGRGTFGSVFLERERATGHLVAVKQLHLRKVLTSCSSAASLASTAALSQCTAEETSAAQKQGSFSSNDMPASLARELSLSSTLSHPNIVQFLDVFIDVHADAAFIVMKPCSGTISTYLKGVARADVPAALLSLSKDLFSALAHLHSQSIIHRDIKPSNLLVTDGVLQLCDFSLARRLPSAAKRAAAADHAAPAAKQQCIQPAAAASSSSSSASSSDITDAMSRHMCTVRFGAPEALQAGQFYGLPVDVWAAGVVLVELGWLCGSPLFGGKTFTDQLHRVELLLLQSAAERSAERSSCYGCSFCLELSMAAAAAAAAAATAATAAGNASGSSEAADSSSDELFDALCAIDCCWSEQQQQQQYDSSSTITLEQWVQSRSTLSSVVNVQQQPLLDCVLTCIQLDAAARPTAAQLLAQLHAL
jgi:serine/threonine protein kinase